MPADMDAYNEVAIPGTRPVAGQIAIAQQELARRAAMPRPGPTMSQAQFSGYQMNPTLKARQQAALIQALRNRQMQEQMLQRQQLMQQQAGSAMTPQEAAAMQAAQAGSQ